MSTSPGSPSPGTRPIWVRPEPGTRRARFSREQIAAAALAIADAEGFEAVSMRRIAAELGAGTMSLYRYISAKDDLVALMDDALMGESLVPDGELPPDWRAALALIARQTRAALLRHPWAVVSLQGRGAAGQDGSFGPNGLRHFEQSLAALDSAPLDVVAKMELLTIVDDYVMGSVLRTGEMQSLARDRPRGHRPDHGVHHGPAGHRRVPADRRAEPGPGCRRADRPGPGGGPVRARPRAADRACRRGIRLKAWF